MYKKILTLVLASLLMFGIPAVAAPSSWAADEVRTAVSNGLVPERIQSEYQAPITREEFCEMSVLMWCKLTEKEMPAAVSPFTDTQNASVAAAKSLGIVNGVSETLFAPQNPISRQEICVMLKNALQAARQDLKLPQVYANTFPDGGAIADWAMEAVQCMHLFAVMLGDENGNINPLGNTTREQAILLTCRLWLTQVMTQQEYIEKFLMPVSGNTHENMLGGAFAIGLGGTLYHSGPEGIFAKGAETPVVDKAAKNMLLYNEHFYYIGADDCIYKYVLADKTETRITEVPTDAFASYNGFLYYRNLAEGGRVYRMALETKETIPFTPGPAELPVPAGNQFYFSDGNAIYAVNQDGTFTAVFSGGNKNLTVRDNKFYFLNQNGILCTADLNGANYTVLSTLPVKSFCFTRRCMLVLGAADGGLYKVDHNGRYTIKMDTGTYEAINTYYDYVYAKDAEGGIWGLTIYGTDKAKMN